MCRKRIRLLHLVDEEALGHVVGGNIADVDQGRALGTGEQGQGVSEAMGRRENGDSTAQEKGGGSAHLHIGNAALVEAADALLPHYTAKRVKEVLEVDTKDAGRRGVRAATDEARMAGAPDGAATYPIPQRLAQQHVAPLRLHADLSEGKEVARQRCHAATATHSPPLHDRHCCPVPLLPPPPPHLDQVCWRGNQLGGCARDQAGCNAGREGGAFAVERGRRAGALPFRPPTLSLPLCPCALSPASAFEGDRMPSGCTSNSPSRTFS